MRSHPGSTCVASKPRIVATPFSRNAASHEPTPHPISTTLFGRSKDKIYRNHYPGRLQRILSLPCEEVRIVSRFHRVILAYLPLQPAFPSDFQRPIRSLQSTQRQVAVRLTIAASPAIRRHVSRVRAPLAVL